MSRKAAAAVRPRPTIGLPPTSGGAAPATARSATSWALGGAGSFAVGMLFTAVGMNLGLRLSHRLTGRPQPPQGLPPMPDAWLRPQRQQAWAAEVAALPRLPAHLTPVTDDRIVAEQQRWMQRPRHHIPRSTDDLVRQGAIPAGQEGAAYVGGMSLCDCQVAPFAQRSALMWQIAADVAARPLPARRLRLTCHDAGGLLQLAQQVEVLTASHRALHLSIIESSFPAAACGRYELTGEQVRFTSHAGARACDDFYNQRQKHVGQTYSQGDALLSFLRYLQLMTFRGELQDPVVELFQSGQVYRRAVAQGTVPRADVLFGVHLNPGRPCALQAATGLLARDRQGLLHLELPLDGAVALLTDAQRYPTERWTRLRMELEAMLWWGLGQPLLSLPQLLATAPGGRDAALSAVDARLQVFAYSESPLHTHVDLANTTLSQGGRSYLLHGEALEQGIPSEERRRQATAQDRREFVRMLMDQQRGSA